MSSLLDHGQKTGLANEYRILHLTMLRSKNQFRSAHWWIAVSKLHGLLRKLMNIEAQYEDINAQIAAKSAKFKKQKRKQAYIDKQQVRLDKLESHFAFLVRRLIVCAPDFWRKFHGILVLGQFITLGFVLLGILAKVHSILRQLPFTRPSFVHKSTISSFAGPSLSVETLEDASQITKQVEKAKPMDAKKRDLGKKKSRKSKKAAAAVFDDIFG